MKLSDRLAAAQQNPTDRGGDTAVDTRSRLEMALALTPSAPAVTTVSLELGESGAERDTEPEMMPGAAADTAPNSEVDVDDEPPTRLLAAVPNVPDAASDATSDATVVGPAPTAASDGTVTSPAPVEVNPRARYVDPLAAVKRTVHQALLDALGPTLYDAAVDESELANRVRQTLQRVLDSEDIIISTPDRARIINEVSDEILGHGPIEPFLRDPSVTEIMVNGADRIYVERDGRLHPVAAAFTDEKHLRRTIDKIVGRVGRRIDESSPMVDARLPDGSRVNAVLPPVSLDGPMLTIRKFAADPFTVQDVIGFGTLTEATARLLEACVRGRLNILISGGTGSGKTTTLNVLSSFVPSTERIVTIEDAAELQLRQDHVVRMESRPSNIEGRGEISTRELVRNSLRMRPDRIIVGEVRDGAAVDMLQAMNTGHDGSLTTLHANSPRDVMSRLETMVLMAGIELPARAIREQAAAAIDLIVHQSRLRDGTRRITHITEVTGMEGEVVTLQDIFMFDFAAGVDERGRFLGTLRPTGVRPQFMQNLADRGVELPAGLFAEWR